MKRYAAALLIALAAAHVSAQTIYRKADVQYPQRDLAPLTILEESTPDLTVYVQEDGIAYTNIAGYTCTFRAAPTPTNSAWIVVTNSTLDTAAGSFLLPFEVADTATNTAGAAWWYTIIVTTDGNRTRYAGSGDLWITNSTVLNSTNILDMTVPLDLDAYIITGTLPWGNLPSGVASQEWVEAQGYVTNAIDVGTTNLTHYDTSEASASTLAATSAADRAYADTQDDSHSTADRQYTDQEVGDHAASQSAHHTRYTDVEAISAGASAGYISSTVINASNAVQDAVQTEHATNVLANVHGGELDPVASAEIATLTNDIANGATSYGWGDHSTNGYLSAEADPVWTNAQETGFTMGSDIDLGGHHVSNAVSFRGLSAYIQFAGPNILLDCNALTLQNSQIVNASDGSYTGTVATVDYVDASRTVVAAGDNVTVTPSTNGNEITYTVASTGGGGGGGFPIPCGPWHKADFSAAAGNSPAFISISDGAGGLMYGRELGASNNTKQAWADSYVSTGGVFILRTPLGWETDISTNAWDAVLGICYGNGLTPFDYVTNAAASFSHTNTAAYTIGNDIEWGRWTNDVGSGFFRAVLDKGDTPSANDSLILFGNPSISVE